MNFLRFVLVKNVILEKKLNDGHRVWSSVPLKLMGN